MIKLQPYKMYSISAKALAAELNIKRVRHTYTCRPRDAIINWGSTYELEGDDKYILNHPRHVQKAANKLTTFECFGEVPWTPKWTTDSEVAKMWLESEYTDRVYCRTKLTSHSGRGIILAMEADQIIPARLYTANAKCSREFRVHLFKGTIFDIQEKKKRRDWTEPSTIGIKNHDNGWIYSRVDIDVPERITTAAIQAVASLELDFGAVDIGYNTYRNKATVFEVNTAPGLVGTTLTQYSETFKNYIRGIL